METPQMIYGRRFAEALLENGNDPVAAHKAAMAIPAVSDAFRNINLPADAGEEPSNANDAAMRNLEYRDAFNECLGLVNNDPVRAHQLLMALPKFSGLAAKFAVKPPAA